MCARAHVYLMTGGTLRDRMAAKDILRRRVLQYYSLVTAIVCLRERTAYHSTAGHGFIARVRGKQRAWWKYTSLKALCDSEICQRSPPPLQDYVQSTEVATNRCRALPRLLPAHLLDGLITTRQTETVQAPPKSHRGTGHRRFALPPMLTSLELRPVRSCNKSNPTRAQGRRCILCKAHAFDPPRRTAGDVSRRTRERPRGVLSTPGAGCWFRVWEQTNEFDKARISLFFVHEARFKSTYS